MWTEYEGSTISGTSIGAREGAALASASTVLLTAPPPGLYRVSLNHEISQAATTSSATQFTLGYTSFAVQALTATNITANTVGARSTTTNLLARVASGDLTYSVTYSSSGATAMQYGLDIVVERIG